MAEDVHQEHMDVIRRIMARWEAGEISTAAKRAAIEQENNRFYGERVPRALQFAPPGNRLAGVLADALGVPSCQAERALQAKRAAFRAASDADDEAVAAGLRETGERLYRDLLWDQVPAQGSFRAEIIGRLELPPGEMREAG